MTTTNEKEAVERAKAYRAAVMLVMHIGVNWELLPRSLQLEMESEAA